jgi:excisionase family DNA binding protein
MQDGRPSATTNTPVLDEQYQTTSTAARVLGVSEATVRRMAERGDLPSIRTSSGLRLFRSESLTRAREARLRGERP